MSPNRRGSKISLLAGVVLVLLLVAGATPYLISKTDDTQEIVDAGVGSDTTSFVQLEEGDTVNLTSFLHIESVLSSDSDNIVRLNVTSDLCNDTKTIELDEGEEVNIIFDVFDVIIEVREITTGEDTFEITHPTEEDTYGISVLLEYMPYLFLLACLICILMMLGVIYK